MISYLDTIDKKETIRVARDIMMKFEKLYSLLTCDLVDIPSPSNFSNNRGSSKFKTHSEKLLYLIEKKDERFKELTEIINAFSTLEESLAELLFMKHIAGFSVAKIAQSRMTSTSKTYSELKEAYYQLAIKMNVEVKA